MRIEFLGTGPSQGIPVIGSTTAASLSQDSRDKRLRTSAKVFDENQNIIIDCGPDFREQMLRSKTTSISAILLTHEHNDHINGLDDIRPFYFMQQKPIEVYCTESVRDALRIKYHYFFSEVKYPGVPEVNFNLIDEASFSIGNIEIQPIPLIHGQIRVTGFKFGNSVYITDCNGIPDLAFQYLQHLDNLVINALNFSPHHSHFSLDEALELIKKIAPKNAFITAVGHRLPPYFELQALLPKNVTLAYDGLIVDFG